MHFRVGNRLPVAQIALVLAMPVLLVVTTWGVVPTNPPESRQRPIVAEIGTRSASDRDRKVASNISSPVAQATPSSELRSRDDKVATPGAGQRAQSARSVRDRDRMREQQTPGAILNRPDRPERTPGTRDR